MTSKNALLGFYLIVIVSPTIINADGLTNFVQLKLNDFPDWVKSRGLDPSPKLPGPSGFVGRSGFVDFYGDYIYHGVKGHGTDDFTVTYISGSLEQQSFYVSYELVGNITFCGNFNATLAIFYQYPRHVQGDWHATFDKVTCRFEIPFNVTANRFINIHEAMVRANIVLPDNLELSDFEFEGVPKDGLDIDMAVIWAFRDYMNSDKGHPLYQAQIQFWKGIFRATPLEEIIGVTLPPSFHF